MDVTEIKFRKGSRFKLDATKTFGELERIRELHGGDILPATVVEEASTRDNYLHSAFDWDDSSAAQKHREETARLLIRSVVVVRAAAPNVESRSYEITKRTPQVGGKDDQPATVYRTTEDILGDPDARQRLLSRAIRELAGMRERYHGLSELAKVFAEADKAFKRYAG